MGATSASTRMCWIVVKYVFFVGGSCKGGATSVRGVGRIQRLGAPSRDPLGALAMFQRQSSDTDPTQDGKKPAKSGPI